METYRNRTTAVVTVEGIWEHDRHIIHGLFGRVRPPTEVLPHVEPGTHSVDQNVGHDDESKITHVPNREFAYTITNTLSQNPTQPQFNRTLLLAMAK
jgi:hypothetical protein